MWSGKANYGPLPRPGVAATNVIPIGAFTSMVHTVSGIVLHRLHRMMQSGDTPNEARLVISEMVRLVKEWDPLFFEKVGAGPLGVESLPEEGFPPPCSAATRSRRSSTPG